MIKQDTDCHIINTASIAGLITAPFQGVYNVCKQGVVALSETLHHDLAFRKSKIKVSVLMPGFVKTQIIDSERNRPDEMKNKSTNTKPHPEFDLYLESFRQLVQGGMSANAVADIVFNAIREEKFCIHTHPDFKKLIKGRLEDILQENDPRSPLRI